jgi:tRNA A-37 threonylcarbamoyl transferase component Bud32
MPDAITFQHYEVLVRDDGTPWELGRGAMGVTYKALDTNLRVPVALKVIHPRQLDSELVAQRFVREARAAARLRHPHIAAVYHLGQEAQNWFYAMEFVAGDTAEALVKREGPLPEPIVLTLAIQAARALNAAAALGLVHRDIKPSNLMLARESDEWQLKLIDFGLARTFAGEESDEDLAAVTHSGFVGTPYYASPEQLEQHELDIRSDIYSLGVTLWFLLTGKVPFTGSVVSVLSQHLHKAPPFEQLDTVASPATRQLIRRMLEKDPGARPQSALDLRRDLEGCEAEFSGTRARPSPPPVAATAPEMPSTAETAETMATPVPKPSAPAFSARESQFDPAQTVAEFGFGQLCRAHERTSGHDFAVLQLGPQRGLDDASLEHLQETVRRAQQIEHQQVWKIHALDSDETGLRIVMSWVEGYVWRDLLRRRRELDPEEAFRLLGDAALGIDAILAAGIDRPDVSLAGLWCEAASPEAPPTNVRVSPLGLLRAVSLDATWIGEGTLAGPSAAGSEAGTPGAIRGLAQVAYETLGGVITTPGFPPLPSLSEGANKILRTALRDPSQFAHAVSLVEQLTHAQSEPGPAVAYRSAPKPAVSRQAATHVPPATLDRESAAQPASEPAPQPIWVEPPPPPIEESVSSIEIPPEHPAEDAEARAEHPDESFPLPTANTPVPEADPELAEAAPESSTPVEWRTPSRSSNRSLVATMVFVLLAGGGAWVFFHDRGEPPIVPTTNSTVSTSGPEPIVAPPLPATAPTPTPLPANPTPVPAVAMPMATPMPATPIPATPPPTPSKGELVRQATERAKGFQGKQQWEQAANEWLSLRRKLPENPAVADIELEQLFREVRWHYTPRTDRSPEVTRAQVDALADEAETAAGFGIPAAMMLLGQHYTQTDWPKAIEWYEKASALTPKGHTRIGLVLANKSPTPENLGKAWQHFQEAAQDGDLDGKISAAECYLYGEMGNPPKPVRGLEKDERRGVAMLQEVIAAAGPGPDSQPDARRADNGETQPNRAKVALATFYLELETKPEADRPAWYRNEAKTVNHGAQLRQLLTEAKGDRAEAYRLLAQAALSGIGGKKDEKAAVEYFKQGKDREDPSCMYNYARHLMGPNPTKSMPAEARDLVIRAAEKGNEKAIQFCQDNQIAFKTKLAP